ncbi:helix-turn-helix domain-containing protein [Hyphomicrobium sp. CS1GBMeth3]|uniref:helix-turn-helix domain-containing protein n=1 Tax=Hyphomicrobium sp. CS1GBMeth3 TaxID=1892845 RepID=UPI000931A9E5|nr:helix-turn-helix domain-containing protein [Hyphomicrobium sp. CS1GBMeth3]
MSIAAINAVTKLLADPECDLQPRTRLVLVLLANFAGKDGTCHPSRRRLAEMAHASEASIKRDVAELANRKIITREERYSPSTGARASNLIRFLSVQGMAQGYEPTPDHNSDHTPAQDCDPPPGSMVIPTYKAEPTIEPTIEPSVVATADARPAKINPAELCAKLMATANGALHPVAKGVGLQSVAEPIGWIQSGADFELDILPAVAAAAHRAAPGSVRSWAYFRSAVSDHKHRREKGLPPPSASITNGGSSKPSHMRRYV